MLYSKKINNIMTIDPLMLLLYKNQSNSLQTKSFDWVSI